MEKLKGFTIELELDGLKVDSGLKDIKQSLKLVNSEMKSNMSAFDYGEKSLKKYGVQLEGLNKKLKVQEAVVESSYKNYQKMVKEHGEGSAKAEKAATSYNYEAAELRNLQRYVQNVTKEMQAFKREQEIQSSTFYKMGDSFQKFGSQLETFSSKLRGVGTNLSKYVTAPITGMATLFGASGFKRAMSLEQVEFMMDHISDTAEEYEKRMGIVKDLVTDTRFGTAEIGNEFAKLLGAGATDESAKMFNEVAMNLATFKSDDSLITRFGDMFTGALQAGSMDGTMINQFASAGVDVLKTLGNVWGKSTEEVRKILRSGDKDIQTVLNDLSTGILEGTDGVNGATKAMGGMLEGSGQLLSGQIKNFYAAISQTGERLIKETGMFDAVKNALSELRNMLKSGELDAILLPTFQGLQKAIEALVDVARKMFKWFSSLSDGTKEWIGKLVGLSAVLGPVLTGIGIFGGILAKAAKGLGSFFKFLAPITKGFGLFGGAAAKTGGAVASTGKSVGLLSRIFTLFTGPVGIAIGIISLLATGFTIAYKKSETFRNFIHKLGDKIKEIFFGIVDWIKPGFDEVKDFFDGIKEKITVFWKSDGQQLMDAFKNIGKFIAETAKIAWEGTKWAFEKIKWIIVDYVMPVVEYVIKKVWGTIKSVITGTLDIIMGAVKIFSGLFTGDWSKMWEGVKQAGIGIIKIIWGVIKNSFFGQIITGLIGFVVKFAKGISDMWVKVKGYFIDKSAEIYKKFSESFIGKIIFGILDFVLNFKKNITKMWNDVKKMFSDKILDVYNSFKDSFVGKLIISIIEYSIEFNKAVKDMWVEIKGKFSEKIAEIYDNFKKSFVGQLISNIIKFAIDFPAQIKKLWESAKRIFSEKINEIYTNLKNSFIGRIITNIINFVARFANYISDMWQNVKRVFVEKITDVYNNLKNSFVGRIISAIINFVKNFKLNITNMWTSIKNTFTERINGIRTMIDNSFVGKMLKSVRTLKSNFIKLAGDMWTGVKKHFNSIVEGAKELPGKIGDGIRNAKDKATNAMKSVGNGMIRWAGTPFNKVVDGVNWVTGKLGIKTTIPKWDYPQYAKGTNEQGHKGGIAMIGEKGRELVKLPDGRSFISPDSHTLLDLPKGTHVIPNQATEKIIKNGLTHIPQYADGTKGWFSKFKDTVGDIWSYVTDPSKLVDKFLDKISLTKNMAEIPKSIVKSSWDYVKTKPYEYVKSMFKKAEDEGGNVTKPNFGGKFTFTSGYGQRWGKLHGGVDFAAPIGTPIPSQTSGKVSYAANGWNGGFGNLVKVKQGIFEHFYAHMSRILASVGQSVSKGDILGLVGNTGDSTGPHVHYELRKNGQRLNPFANGLKGFKTGGIIKNRMMAMLGEDGEEIVIPTAKNRRTDAMKLLALAAKKIGVEGGNYTRPGSLTSNNQDDGFKELLQATVEQNEYLSNMVDLLMQLLEKDVEAVVAFEPLYNMIKNRKNRDKHSQSKQRRR